MNKKLGTAFAEACTVLILLVWTLCNSLGAWYHQKRAMKHVQRLENESEFQAQLA